MDVYGKTITGLGPLHVSMLYPTFYTGEKMLLVADETHLFLRILKMIPAALNIAFSVRLNEISDTKRKQFASLIYTSNFARKSVFGVCDQTRLNIACSATQTSYHTGFSLSMFSYYTI